MIEQTVSFLGRVVPDGREVIGRATVVHRRDFVIVTAQITDEEGTEVALAHLTALLAERGESHRSQEPERVLATVMFTDVVASTEHVARLGDRQWRDVLALHDTAVRRELERFRGREVKSTGDGFLATFDGPGRAIRGACAIRDAVRSLGVEVRVGLHTGEIELRGDDIGGIAVHIGQRISALADPGEVLVSSTVKDLVTGSGVEFKDRGTHELRNVPGRWRLFRVLD